MNQAIKIYKIEVLENGIEKKSILSIKTELIPFIEIEDITIEKLRVSSLKGNPINDGYSFSTINLKKGKEIIISPDQFENYNEIMAAKKSKLD